MVDTPPVWELNIWYHTLNAGYRTRVSGETDFPCIYGERVGLGRSYVKLDGKLDYDSWCEGVRRGRNYVSDGYSHLIDFQVNDVAMGDLASGSEVKLKQPGAVRVTAKVAAMLDERPNAALRNSRFWWQIEKARVGEARTVPVELIVNGHAAARKEIVADGKLRDIEFATKVDRSSWIALRIFPSSHSNPIWVTIDGRPVRERKSIEWCLKGVDQCWSQKKRFIKAAEMDDAIAAYDHARKTYQQRLSEAK
jgi:hypothetical protein